MLLKKADTLPELSIRSLKEWRIWLELKRLKEDIRLKLNNNNLDQIDQIEGFKVGEVEISLKKDELLIDLKDKQLVFSYAKFLQNPRAILNKIIGSGENKE